MAVLIYGHPCPICGQPMTEGQSLFGTWGVWLEADDPLVRYCDAMMHWDCYAAWPHRPRFAATYFDNWCRHRNENPYWHTALLEDDILVTVNPAEPVAEAQVHLKATGSRHFVKLREWEDWLLAAPSPQLHPVEAETLHRAKQQIRVVLPTRAALLEV